MDLNSTAKEEENGIVVMICVKNKTRLVRISDKARHVRDIEFPGCLVSTRRRNFACVADARSYALLDVENQQKISLFPISSLDENVGGGRVENISSAAERSSSSSRPISNEGSLDGKGHGRSTSLGAFVGGLGRRQTSPRSGSRERSGLATPEGDARDRSPVQASSHNRNVSTPETPSTMPPTLEKPLPVLPARSDSLRGHSPARLRSAVDLKPHICSPTPAEFLLTTGTTVNEAGVGIFINLDGEVVRGTLQFDRYPRAVVVDGHGAAGEPTTLEEDPEGYVLATMTQSGDGGEHNVVEIQRWDTDDGGHKEWLDVPEGPSPAARPKPNGEQPSLDTFSIRKINTNVIVPFPEIGQLLRGKRLRLDKEGRTSRGAQESAPKSPPEGWEISRDKEEVEFGRRLIGRASRLVLWSGSALWWIVKNPLALKLDAAINEVLPNSYGGHTYGELDRSRIIQVVNAVRGQEATSETEF